MICLYIDIVNVDLDIKCIRLKYMLETINCNKVDHVIKLNNYSRFLKKSIVKELLTSEPDLDPDSEKLIVDTVPDDHKYQ